MIRLAAQLWAGLHRKPGARIAFWASIGVVGMTLGVLLQANQLLAPRNDPRLEIASVRGAGQPGQAHVGHLIYNVLSAHLQQLPNPKDPDEPLLEAHISVRITDVQGISDYIDNQTFRLVVDGETLSHSNNVNLTVHENSATQADLTFRLSEKAPTAELLVGRPTEGVGRIALDLLPRRIADGS